MYIDLCPYPCPCADPLPPPSTTATNNHLSPVLPQFVTSVLSTKSGVSCHCTVLEFIHSRTNEENGVATISYLRLHTYGNVL